MRKLTAVGAARPSHPIVQRLVAIALSLTAGAVLWHATANATGLAPADLAQRLMDGSVRAPAAAPAAVEVAPEPVLVWEGLDVDGDGAADFVNPTGQAPRTHDAYGSGHFGASRGHRSHQGVDYAAAPGQQVVAPISGYITKIGLAYPGDPGLRFVEISNPALKYVARVFYVDPTVAVGQTVALGQPIGSQHSLASRYPGDMTDHVHLEIAGPDRRKVDTERLIVARLEHPDA